MIGPSGLIARSRSREAALATTTGTLTRDSGPGAFDETTATYAAGARTTIYTGAALTRPITADQVDSGETSTEVYDYLVKFPADTAVELGDVWTVTASVHDAGLVGQAMVVAKVTLDEWQITRRAECNVQTDRPA